MFEDWLAEIRYKFIQWLVGRDAVAMNVGVYFGKWYSLNGESRLFLGSHAYTGWDGPESENEKDV